MKSLVVHIFHISSEKHQNNDRQRCPVSRLRRSGPFRDPQRRGGQGRQGWQQLRRTSDPNTGEFCGGQIRNKFWATQFLIVFVAFCCSFLMTRSYTTNKLQEKQAAVLRMRGASAWEIRRDAATPSVLQKWPRTRSVWARMETFIVIYVIGCVAVLYNTHFYKILHNLHIL